MYQSVPSLSNSNDELQRSSSAPWVVILAKQAQLLPHFGTRIQRWQMNVETHAWLHVGPYSTVPLPLTIEDSFNQYVHLAEKVKWAKIFHRDLRWLNLVCSCRGPPYTVWHNRALWQFDPFSAHLRRSPGQIAYTFPPCLIHLSSSFIMIWHHLV